MTVAAVTGVYFNYSSGSYNNNNKKHSERMEIETEFVSCSNGIIVIVVIVFIVNVLLRMNELT